MRRRSPARWLAPLALVTCAVAIYVVVDHELLSDDGGASTTSPTTSKSGAAAATTSTTKTNLTHQAHGHQEGQEIHGEAGRLAVGDRGQGGRRRRRSAGGQPGRRRVGLA